MASFFKKLAYWLPTFIWMSMIFSVSAQPTLHTSPVGWQDFALKKTAHVIEYCILAILIDYSLRHTTHFSRSKRLIFTLLIIAGYAVSDELHQRMTPTRDGRLRDVIIDILGGSIGIYIYRYFSKSTAR